MHINKKGYDIMNPCHFIRPLNHNGDDALSSGDERVVTVS